MREENPDTWIEHCKNQEKLDDAIVYAALAENHLGKRNNHQKRRKKLNLEKFAANLVDIKPEIQKAKSFDELLLIIENCKIKGIGPLTCYDTAQRIGAKIKLFPEHIYLHAGTKTGAEKLLGKRLNLKFINITDLPNPFQNENLTNAEIEDILCIYKDRF
ncbi:MAG: hypothetical protein ACSHW7_14345 [Patiriisocius sp.]|uniref:hypothetical protein n=1 Tax=Patiriisocius sp. TaxID=2822396 RepID=UPI003EF51429